MAQPGNRILAKLKTKILVTSIFLIVIPLLVYFLLFRVNTFSLEIRPLENAQTVVSAGSEFQDPGAEVYLVGTFLGRNGYRVSAEVEATHDVNTDKPGDYLVRYASSWNGLAAAGTRVVTVVDRTPPEITLVSLPGHFTVIGQVYQEEGYSAWDACDGDLTSYVTRLNDGEFITYIVSDRAGNCTTVSRKIPYRDQVAPEIQLLGDSTLHIKAGEGFTEPGWTAQDNVDGDITHWVKVSGQVDKYLAGNYQLTYTLCDSAGNQAQAQRTVIVDPVGIPDTVIPEDKVIYLTFDDGPGPYTGQLLEILEKYGVKATFFVVDSDYKDVLKEITEAGHSIGIHSVKHDYYSIYESPEAYFQDLLTMQEIIYEQTGVMTWLMRFPGGSSNTISRFNEGIMSYLTQAVEDCGFRYFDWNVDSDDAGRTKKAEKVYKNVIAGLKDRRVSIVLQHDIKGYSVEAVEKILQWGLENGYQFLALDMTSPMAHHGVNN